MHTFEIILTLTIGSTIGSPVSIVQNVAETRAGYFEGDMRFGENITTRSGLIGNEYRWPDKTLPYKTDESFTSEELTVIQNAFTEIQTKTCIKFVRQTNEKNYVHIVRGSPGSGCWSYVGRRSDKNDGMQELNLQPGSPGCIFHGVIVHEILHALGVVHEQSRTDRDDYVKINWDNIYPKQQHNFDKYSADEVYDQGIPYDYNSVMHYGAYAFAINPSIPTIITQYEIGQRSGLSGPDSAKIRKMYQC